MKTLLLKFFMLIFLFSEISCGEDVPECTNMCVISGGWALVEAYADDVKETQDLSRYKLTLVSPNPTDAIVSDFDRTQPSGAEDNGTWSIINNGTILQLTSDDNPGEPEDWEIESFTLRKLVLVLTREDADIKGGPDKIRLVLEPF
jgi:hypothetical protein